MLPAGDPRTFRSFMERHAWGRTGLRRERCDIPDGGAPDLEARVPPLRAAIAAAGGIDLGDPGRGRGRPRRLQHARARRRCPRTSSRLPDGLAASLGVPPEEWPLRAITMGIGTIRKARRILVLATGAAKATAVRALVHGPEDPEWPCSFLGTHPNMEVLLDPTAAARL